MIDREQAVKVVHDLITHWQIMGGDDLSGEIVDAILALPDPLVSDLEHRLRVLAEAAVEDEQEIEHQREAMRALIDALEQDTIPGRIAVPYARVKAILADGNRIPLPITDEMIERAVRAGWEAERKLHLRRVPWEDLADGTKAWRRKNMRVELEAAINGG